MEGSLLEHIRHDTIIAATSAKSCLADNTVSTCHAVHSCIVECLHLVVLLACVIVNHISMLKRPYSMDLDTPLPELSEFGDNGEIQHKKLRSSPEHPEERKQKEEEPKEASPDRRHARRSDPYKRFKDNAAHVTQSRSIFSHEDCFVYGNPKELIKPHAVDTPQGPQVSEATPELSVTYDTTSSNVLDLSCKAGKTEESRPQAPGSNEGNEGNTYQNFHRGINESPFARSNLEIKLVTPPSKKPTVPEQLQIAKIQQQQRRSIQQQQKMLQQMRRSLDHSGKSSSSTRGHHHSSSNSLEPAQGNHKAAHKYFGNHDSPASDSQSRVKEDYSPALPGPHFPQPQYPFFDPNHPKELPESHPILPLLDPVYFSALYNAHGFLPPSSPNIAAAFIGTLQDALPKLPMMFPSTSTNNTNPLLPHKGSDTPN